MTQQGSSEAKKPKSPEEWQRFFDHDVAAPIEAVPDSDLLFQVTRSMIRGCYKREEKDAQKRADMISLLDDIFHQTEKITDPVERLVQRKQRIRVLIIDTIRDEFVCGAREHAAKSQAGILHNADPALTASDTAQISAPPLLRVSADRLTPEQILDSVAVEVTAEFITTVLEKYLGFLGCPPAPLQYRKNASTTQPLYMVPRSVDDSEMAHITFVRAFENVSAPTIRRSATLKRIADEALAKIRPLKVIQQSKLTGSAFKISLKESPAVRETIYQFLRSKDDKMLSVSWLLKQLAHALRDLGHQTRRAQDALVTDGAKKKLTPAELLQVLQKHLKENNLAGTELLDYDLLADLCDAIASLTPAGEDVTYCKEFASAYENITPHLFDRDAIMRSARSAVDGMEQIRHAQVALHNALLNNTGLSWPLNEIFVTSLFHTDSRFTPEDLMGYYKLCKGKKGSQHGGDLVFTEFEMQLPDVCERLLKRFDVVLEKSRRHQRLLPQDYQQCQAHVAALFRLADSLPSDHTFATELIKKYQTPLNQRLAGASPQEAELLRMPLAYITEVQRLREAHRMYANTDQRQLSDPKVPTGVDDPRWRQDPYKYHIVPEDQRIITSRFTDLRVAIFKQKLSTNVANNIATIIQSLDSSCGALQGAWREITQNTQNFILECTGQQFYALYQLAQSLCIHPSVTAAAKTNLQTLIAALRKIEHLGLKSFAEPIIQLESVLRQPSSIQQIARNGLDKDSPRALEMLDLLVGKIKDSDLSLEQKGQAEKALRGDMTSISNQVIGLRNVLDRYQRTDGGKARPPIEPHRLVPLMHEQYVALVMEQLVADK